jgi:tetratricopeptide (TPR) repeat protein
MAEEHVENLGEPIITLEEKIEKYKKPLIIGLIAIVAIVAGSWAYGEFVVKPRNEKAKSNFWKAEYVLLETGDYETAINGDANGTFMGLAAFVKKYGNTPSGNLAYYDLGVAYLNTGKFQEAINALEKFEADDEILSSIRLGAIGDAHLELGNKEKAADFYIKAAKNSNNFFTGGIYLNKAALAYELMGKNDKALSTYEELADKYPNSQEGRQALKHIARLKK